jgi:hypothetical protein
MNGNEIVLNEDQQLELSRVAQSRSLPAGYVFRARLILMLSEGASFSTIKDRLRTTAPTISRWKGRFLAAGIDALDTFHPGQPATVLTPPLRPGYSRPPVRSPMMDRLTGVAASWRGAWYQQRRRALLLTHSGVKLGASFSQNASPLMSSGKRFRVSGWSAKWQQHRSELLVDGNQIGYVRSSFGH